MAENTGLLVSVRYTFRVPMMKQLRLVVAIAATTLLAAASALTTGAPVGAQTDKPDILFREDFEAPFVTDPFCGTGRCQVPSGWEIWWVPRRDASPAPPAPSTPASSPKDWSISGVSLRPPKKRSVNRPRARNTFG